MLKYNRIKKYSPHEGHSVTFILEKDLVTVNNMTDIVAFELKPFMAVPATYYTNYKMKLTVLSFTYILSSFTLSETSSIYLSIELLLWLK